MSRFLFTLLAVHRPPAAADQPGARAARARPRGRASTAARPCAATVEREGFAFFGFDRLDQERGFARRARDGGGRRPRPAGRGGCCRCCAPGSRTRSPTSSPTSRTCSPPSRPTRSPPTSRCGARSSCCTDRGPVPVALSSTFMGPLIPGPGRARLRLRPPGAANPPCARAGPRHHARSPSSPRRRCAGRSTRSAPSTGSPPLGTSVNRATARLPLYLVGNIRELDYDRRDLPASVHYIGNNLWFPPPTARGVGVAGRDPGRPPLGPRHREHARLRPARSSSPRRPRRSPASRSR